MCGIVGYIGTQKASPILIDGLLKLEYRGYDSAGISTIEDGMLSIMKNKGRVKNLYDLDGINDLKGTIGIAHTRWATHGKPSKENSHPHLDNSNSFAVVHNGIIENYFELREFLSKNGYNFLSQTDTEVIPNLIHYYYTKENSDYKDRFLKSVHKACMDLKGSFAIEVISKLHPDIMIVVRKDSPLVIGTAENESYISSDIPAMLSFTKKFYLLNDLEFVTLYKNKIEFFDSNLNKIEKEPVSIQWDASSAQKDGYEDFMLKEIYEQPKSIRETIGLHLSSSDSKTIFDELNFSKKALQNISKIYIIACGTAMHAGLAGKTIIEKLSKIPTEVEVASEFRYRNPLIDEKTLAIFVSQSGETADTIAALKLVKSKGGKTIAISNVIGSSITREADYTVYTHAGPEIAVASTKAYTAQVILLSLLGIYFAETLEVESTLLHELKEDSLSLPSKIEELLKDTTTIKNFAKKIFNENDIFFLGRGTDYSVSMEASLKLKEISYIHSDSYAAGELKHGPIALIENGTTVIATVTDPNLVEKTLSNVQEVISRGAKTLIITNQDLGNMKFDEVIKIPKCHHLLSPIISIIPSQLLAYYVTKEKGLDVDKPRNLAKSVTVE